MDDPVVGNFTPWHLNGSPIPHGDSTAGSHPPDQGWCKEFALSSIWFLSIPTIFHFLYYRKALSSPYRIVEHNRSRTIRAEMAKRARFYVNIFRSEDVCRTLVVQGWFLIGYLLLYTTFCDDKLRTRILHGFDQTVDNEGTAGRAASAIIILHPEIWTRLFSKLRPCAHFCRRLLGPRSRPLPFIYPKFICRCVREALYVSTLPVEGLWASWPGADATLVNTLLVNLIVMGFGELVSPSPDIVAFLKVWGELDADFCSNCDCIEEDLGGCGFNWASDYTDYDLETATSWTPQNSQWLCRQCAALYKKRV